MTEQAIRRPHLELLKAQARRHLRQAWNDRELCGLPTTWRDAAGFIALSCAWLLATACVVGWALGIVNWPALWGWA